MFYRNSRHPKTGKRSVRIVSEPGIRNRGMVAIWTLRFLFLRFNSGSTPTTVAELFMSLAPEGGTGFPHLEVELW